MSDEILSVFERIEQLLTGESVPFVVTRHDPVFTSEEAARVRGVNLSSGAKALICKSDDQFIMFVMSADRKLDSKRFRKENGVRKIRFATREEVMEKTGLTPGSIPPFGGLFSLPTMCDESLLNEPTINFNAGDHTISVSMKFADYRKVESPQLGGVYTCDRLDVSRISSRKPPVVRIQGFLDIAPCPMSSCFRCTFRLENLGTIHEFSATGIATVTVTSFEASVSGLGETSTFEVFTFNLSRWSRAAASTSATVAPGTIPTRAPS